jgi:hypothetical protein
MLLVQTKKTLHLNATIKTPTSKQREQNSTRNQPHPTHRRHLLRPTRRRRPRRRTRRLRTRRHNQPRSRSRNLLPKHRLRLPTSRQRRRVNRPNPRLNLARSRRQRVESDSLCWRGRRARDIERAVYVDAFGGHADGVACCDERGAAGRESFVCVAHYEDAVGVGVDEGVAVEGEGCLGRG